MSITSFGLPSIRFLGFVVLLLTPFAASIEADIVSVVPKPVSLKMKEGKFLFKPGMTILATPALVGEAQLFARTVAPAIGFTPEVRASRPGSAPHVEMKLDPSLKELGDEGYRLDVSPRRIVLRAPKAAGIFYGTQTLRQLLPVQVYRKQKWKAPNGVCPVF